jgi:hypothetical protein
MRRGLTLRLHGRRPRLKNQSREGGCPPGSTSVVLLALRDQPSAAAHRLLASLDSD